MAHLCDIATKLALDAVFWLPIKIVGHYLQPFTAMMDDLAENTNQQIKEYAREHNFDL